ncbi:hypothetical protein [Methyloceanibacter caenitepidi]|uniref:Uncharacterized protein n=1 Tax=Methyloceanibacter caenitepidi TaxID=1384459 RepID=A0A0A8K691_9HYPH|nr:hypothetical protein [Methyloceanibacter caenitepidi]BAQ18301.1 hypothetical protein GL4_2868 [Methyloceanibacter caenitepidi]
MAEWPLSLPTLPLRDGYEEELAETRLRTSMDAGPAKMRGRFSAGMDTISLAFHMTKAQVAILESFYKNTLGGGALPFDYVHPRTLEQRSFRFVSAPKWSEIAPDLWGAVLQVEFLGSAEALTFIDMDFGVSGNSGYLIFLEDI